MNNSFEKTLREMRRGASANELSEELAKLVAAVLDTGKAGRLTYKLTVNPCNDGEGITVQLDDDINVSLPRKARGSSIFYSGDGNVLQRTDPRQTELKLSEVPKVEPSTQEKASNQ